MTALLLGNSSCAGQGSIAQFTGQGVLFIRLAFVMAQGHVHDRASADEAIGTRAQYERVAVRKEDRKTSVRKEDVIEQEAVDSKSGMCVCCVWGD